jgi:hypothetical protein
MRRWIPLVRLAMAVVILGVMVNLRTSTLTWKATDTLLLTATVIIATILAGSIVVERPELRRVLFPRRTTRMRAKTSTTQSLALGQGWLRLCAIGMDDDMRRWALGTAADELNKLARKGMSALMLLTIALRLGLAMAWGTLGANRTRAGGVLTGAAAGFGVACGIQSLSGQHTTPGFVVLVIALSALGGIIGCWANATVTPPARRSAAGKKPDDTTPQRQP